MTTLSLSDPVLLNVIQEKFHECSIFCIVCNEYDKKKLDTMVHCCLNYSARLRALEILETYFGSHPLIDDSRRTVNETHQQEQGLRSFKELINLA